MKSPNLWHGLLFLQGHVTDAGLARELAGEPAPLPEPSPGAAGVLGHVRYLGGRSMHAGHNFDVEEPFDDLPVAAHGEPAPRSARATRGTEQPAAC